MSILGMAVAPCAGPGATTIAGPRRRRTRPAAGDATRVQCAPQDLTGTGPSLDATDFGRRAERAAEKRRHRPARTQPADHDREPEAAAIGDLRSSDRRAPL